MLSSGILSQGQEKELRYIKESVLHGWRDDSVLEHLLLKTTMKYHSEMKYSKSLNVLPDAMKVGGWDK